MATGTINLQVGSPDLMTCGIDAGAVVGPREVFVIASAQNRIKRVVVPANYGGSMVCKMICQMTTAVAAATVVINVDFDAKTPGSDDLVDTANYDGVNASTATTVPNAVTKEFLVTVICTNLDSAAVGDDLRVRITVTNAGAPGGNLNLLHAWLEYTTA